MNKENSISMEYWPADDNEPRVTIEYHFCHMNIFDYKKFCEGFAKVLGYNEEDINAAFGDNKLN